MPIHNTIKDEALSALIMLGFGKQVAEKALENVIKRADSELTVEQMIKQALKNL
ncbi:Holliday junction DNA helicase RuvA [compost metagenome]